jgi:hypothetical protein
MALKTIAGIKKRSTAKKKKAPAGKRRVSGIAKKVGKVTSVSRMDKGLGMVGAIERLKTRHKNEKSREKREILALEINKKIDELEALKIAYKRAK